jgi:hypothetical protein
MEGPTSSRGLRNRITCLTLQELDDDDEVVKCLKGISMNKMYNSVILH